VNFREVDPAGVPFRMFRERVFVKLDRFVDVAVAPQRAGG
jgi:hypothetical protein